MVESLSIGKLRLHYLHAANEDMRVLNFDAAREDIKSFLRTIDKESIKSKELIERIENLLEKEGNVEKEIARQIQKVGYPEQALILNVADWQYRKKFLEKALDYAWMLAQKERLFEEV